jgi:hypothetical protein
MPIGRKYERDIDLLLAEEFKVSPEFATWFLGKTKFAGWQASVVDVSVSKSDYIGESDLVVIYTDSSGTARYAIHIKDKIDAPLQPQQEQRYRQRAEYEMSQGDYGDYDLVLCSPTLYLKNQPDAGCFDTYVSYEEIAEFIANNDLSPRGQYRAHFVATSASPTINSWKKVDDEVTNRFWHEAYKIASHEFPILEMKEPSLTKDSTWINFRPHDMPKIPRHVYISFKGNRGYMDLTLERCIAHKFRERVRQLLEREPGMTVHQTGQSAAIRLQVRGFSVAEPFEDNEPKVREAFGAYAKLIQFYRTHRKVLDAAAAACDIGT